MTLYFSCAPSSRQQTGVTCSVLQEQRTALHAQISHCCHLAHGSHSLLAHKLLLVLAVHAADSVWVSLTHVQAITGEIAELTMEVSNGQSHCSSSKQKAMLQVARLQNYLPRKGDNYLLIASSYKLTLEGVSCQEIAEFQSTEKKE